MEKITKVENNKIVQKNIKHPCGRDPASVP